MFVDAQLFRGLSRAAALDLIVKVLGETHAVLAKKCSGRSFRRMFPVGHLKKSLRDYFAGAAWGGR